MGHLFRLRVSFPSVPPMSGRTFAPHEDRPAPSPPPSGPRAFNVPEPRDSSGFQLRDSGTPVHRPPCGWAGGPFRSVSFGKGEGGESLPGDQHKTLPRGLSGCGHGAGLGAAHGGEPLACASTALILIEYQNEFAAEGGARRMAGERELGGGM